MPLTTGNFHDYLTCCFAKVNRQLGPTSNNLQKALAPTTLVVRTAQGVCSQDAGRSQESQIRILPGVIAVPLHRTHVL